MDKELTPIQQQVIKSIEKSIEKDLKDIEALEAKFLKDEQAIQTKIQSLKDQLSDTRGIYMANKELAEMSIDKAKKALSVFIGDINEQPTVAEPVKIEEVPATIKVNVLNPKNDETEYASEAHKKEVEDLPWDTIDDDTVDEQMPFKGIFSSKKD